MSSTLEHHYTASSDGLTGQLTVRLTGDYKRWIEKISTEKPGEFVCSLLHAMHEKTSRELPDKDQISASIRSEP